MTDRQEDRIRKIESRVETMFWCMHHLVGHDAFMAAMTQVISDRADEATDAEFRDIVKNLNTDTTDPKETDQ